MVGHCFYRFGTNRLFALFIVALAILLRLPNLNQSLWYDEVFYSTRFVASSLPKLWEQVLSEPPAPFYRLVLYGWTGLFGENEIVVRIPSLICGVAAIFLTYGIARKYGGVQAAFLAALFLCFSPPHVWYSQEATPYALAMCLVLATVLIWHELKSGKRPKYWHVFYGVFLLCAIFTHYLAAVYLLPLTVLVFDASSVARKRIIAINLFAGALAASAITVKHQLGSTGVGMSFLRPFTLFEWWMLFFNWFLHGNSIWSLSPYRTTLQDVINSRLFFSCQIIFLLILIQGLVPRHGQVWHKVTLELSLFLIVLPLAMLSITLAGYQKIYIERYLLMGLPFFAIVLARGATGFSNRWISGISTAAVVMLGVISYAMFLSKSDEWTVYKSKPDMRGAARHLTAENISADETMIVLPRDALTLAFYIDRQASANHAVVQDSYDAAKLDQSIVEGKLKVFYAVKSRWEGRDFQRLYDFLEQNQRLTLTATRSFKGVEVYTFVPR
jgi:uncharacterized membrane protein